MERGIGPGSKPKGKVKIKWSANFAYAIGLLATDGCLSPNGRHIILTSVDKEQLENYLKCLNIEVKLGRKTNGHGQTALVAQFSDVLFFDFLESIGMTKAKSLTMGRLLIPEKYFFDFLRGCFDGDGCSYSYWDPRWKSSYMFYISFASGSKKFMSWLQEEVDKRIRVKSHLTVSKKKINPYYQLRYSKYAAVTLTKQMYAGKSKISLTRKRLKINESLGIMGLPHVK